MSNNQNNGVITLFLWVLGLSIAFFIFKDLLLGILGAMGCK